MAATITSTASIYTNATTSVTYTTLITADGACLQKTVYKVQHWFAARNPGYEHKERERLIARAPTKLLLHIRCMTICNVTKVTETLTRVGPTVSPAVFMRHVHRLRAHEIMLTTQQTRLALRQVTPRVRVLAIRRVGTVQNNKQPPPYSAADEALLNAARARAIARRR